MHGNGFLVPKAHFQVCAILVPHSQSNCQRCGKVGQCEHCQGCANGMGGVCQRMCDLQRSLFLQRSLAWLAQTVSEYCCPIDWRTEQGEVSLPLYILQGASNTLLDSKKKFQIPEYFSAAGLPSFWYSLLTHCYVNCFYSFPSIWLCSHKEAWALSLCRRVDQMLPQWAVCTCRFPSQVVFGEWVYSCLL